MNYQICKYCVMKFGIKGSDLAEQHLATDEDLYNHIEEIHGIPVRREGETDKDAKARCAQKGIVADRTKCQCYECKTLRGEITVFSAGEDMNDYEEAKAAYESTMRDPEEK